MMQAIKACVPLPVKQRIKEWLIAGGHPAVPEVKGLARVLDMYVWIADGKIDTIIPIHNYFSVLFPDLDTRTQAHVELFGAQGDKLGETDIPVPQMATPTVSVLALLQKLGIAGQTFGNLVWDLHTPEPVRRQLAATNEPFLLWDRSYIGYVGSDGQTSFVHGIDKTWVVKEDEARIPWPMRKSDRFTASPEIPLMLAETTSTEILVQNRAAAARTINLSAHDQSGQSRSWSASVPARGAHRFVMIPGELKGLNLTQPLTLRVEGLPTRYGRAIVFRRFTSGAISAMHC
jgi:hypothetical protein